MDHRPGSVPAPGMGPLPVIVPAPVTAAQPEGLGLAHIVALAAAGAALVSLWLPWYRVRIGDAVHDAVSAHANELPPGFAGFAQSLTAALPREIHATAWQAFQGADVAIAALAGGIAVVLLAAAGAFGPALRATRQGAASVAAWGGAALAALVAWKVLHYDFPTPDISIAVGAWVALAASIAVSVSGWLAGGGR